jgi:hypothetical protein
VWKADTLSMNPSVDRAVIDEAYAVDAPAARAEYGAEFRDDIESFLATAWVEHAVQTGRHELAPQASFRYLAAIDSSGGGADAFTLSIVHTEGNGAERRVVQDVMRGWSKPRDGQADLEGAVREIASIAKRYGVTAISGDRYAAGWVREAFRRYGITYQDATVRGKDGAPVYLDKSRAFLEIAPLFAQGLISILDNPRLEHELKSLERRTQAGGKDRVDHPRGQHDDHANALALAAAKARASARPFAGPVIRPGAPPMIGEPRGSAGSGQAAAAISGRSQGQVEWVRRWYG